MNNGITGHGRKDNQKLKPLLVWYYLCKYSDENHFMTGKGIAEILDENGIHAERRSIYSDIEQLNLVLYMMDNDCSLDEAQDALDYDPECATVKYKKKHGFYIQHQNYDVDSIRLLAESVYSARFIDNSQMNQLIDVIKNLISDYQAEKIEHEILNIDLARTTNKDVFFYVSKINEAMSTNIEGKAHTPEKISFKYMKYSINDMKQSLQKKEGLSYIVSPYKLILSDGNYYLRCFDDSDQKMKTFRIDRMKNVTLTGEPRSGKDVASKENYKEYTKRVFSMFGGKKELVKLSFTMSSLDAVIERLGSEKMKYHRTDDHHFTIITEVEISPQFFAWLCGFGSSVEILEPISLKNKYTKYLEDILKKYK